MCLFQHLTTSSHFIFKAYKTRPYISRPHGNPSLAAFSNLVQMSLMRTGSLKLLDLREAIIPNFCFQVWYFFRSLLKFGNNCSNLNVNSISCIIFLLCVNKHLYCQENWSKWLLHNLLPNVRPYPVGFKLMCGS